VSRKAIDSICYIILLVSLNHSSKSSTHTGFSLDRISKSYLYWKEKDMLKSLGAGGEQGAKKPKPISMVFSVSVLTLIQIQSF